jgi:hypothetical protein
MKNVPIIISLCIISAMANASDFSATTQIYNVNKNIANSTTMDAKTQGAYVFLGYKKNSIELELDKQKVNNQNSQQDQTFIYSNYQIPNWQIKVGAHRIHFDVSDKSLNNYSLGAQYTEYSSYGYALWLAGVDIYAADSAQFTNLLTAPVGAKLTQASPYARKYFAGFKEGQYYYLEGLLNGQKFDEKVNGHDVYVSGETILAYGTPKWLISANAILLGSNVNLLQKNGLVIQDDGFTHKKSYGIDVQYQLTTHAFVKASITKQHYVDAFDNKNSFTNSGLFLGFNF